MNIFKKLWKYLLFYIFGNSVYDEFYDILDDLFSDILLAQKVKRKSVLFIIGEQKYCIVPKNNGGYILTYLDNNNMWSIIELKYVLLCLPNDDISRVLINREISRTKRHIKNVMNSY